MESSCNSRWHNNNKNLSLLNPNKEGEEEEVPNLIKPLNRSLFSFNSNSNSSKIESSTINNNQMDHKTLPLSNSLHLNNNLSPSMALHHPLTHSNPLCISSCHLNSSNPLATPCSNSNSPINPRCNNLNYSNSNSQSHNHLHIHRIF